MKTGIAVKALLSVEIPLRGSQGVITLRRRAQSAGAEMGVHVLRVIVAGLLLSALAIGLVWATAFREPGSAVLAQSGHEPGAFGAAASGDSSAASNASVASRSADSGAVADAIEGSGPQARAEKPTLEDLRVGDAYIEFAETRRARFAPGVDRGFYGFGWDGADGNYYYFDNSSLLWNEIVEPIRDDLLAAGPEWVGDVLGEPVRHPYVGIVDREAGRPQVIAFYAFVGDADGSPSMRIHAAKVHVWEEGKRKGKGKLIARMGPFEVDPAAFASWEEMAVEHIRAPLDDWASS